MAHNGNWFAVSRLIFDHPVVGIHDRPFTDLEAWLWLLAEAAFEPLKVNNKGTVIVLDPGQMMHARTYLAKRWKWTEDKVRWFLKRLQNEAMIARFCTQQTTRHRANQIQIITICNYGQYQFSQANQQPAEPPSQHPANTQRAPSQHPQDNNSTPKQEDSPLPPKGGRQRSISAEKRAEATRAFAIYNEAAKLFGFQTCSTITQDRITRMVRRLDAIGGVDNFRIALWAIRSNDFLMGRRAPRDGESPFRLDIEKLLSTRSGLGDVLAGLLDVAIGNPVKSEGVNLKPDWWKNDPFAKTLPPEWWRVVIARYANGTWPVQFLGPGPWDPEKYLVHKQVSDELDLCSKYPTPDGVCAVAHLH